MLSIGRFEEFVVVRGDNTTEWDSTDQLMTCSRAKQSVAENILQCVVKVPCTKESSHCFGDEQILSLFYGIAESVAFLLCRMSILDSAIDE